MREQCLSIKYVSPDDLIPYDGNARTHSDAQIDEIVKSLIQNGWTNPILLDGNYGIIAGHGRLMAARKLGMDLVPTIDLQFASDAQKAQYIIADNKLALNAGWDFDILNVQFDLIEDAGLDLMDTGFSEDELTSIREETLNEGLCDEDEIPEIIEKPKTKMGDVWLLGNHRLMCGDSTVIDQIEKLYDKFNPIIMITDPPYGVNYDPEWREGCDLGIGKRSKGKVENDHKIDWTDAYSLFRGNIVYIWHAAIYSSEIANHIRNCGFEIVSQIIWVKQHFALSRGDYHWQHEPCWYAVKKGKKHNWQGARDQSTTWNIKNNNSFGNSNKEETFGHGTQKPVELMSRPIFNNTSNGDYIYDPFGGSGSTLIACEKTNRKCLMMEISPAYCDVIVNRWQKFSGKKAILESTNQTFDEVAYG